MKATLGRPTHLRHLAVTVAIAIALTPVCLSAADATATSRAASKPTTTQAAAVTVQGRTSDGELYVCCSRAELAMFARYVLVNNAERQVFEMDIDRGQLASVSLVAKTEGGGVSDERSDTCDAFFLYDGNQRSFQFDWENPTVLLNGKPIWLDLTASETPDFLDKPEMPATIEGVKLTGAEETDLKALKKLAGNKLRIIDLSRYGSGKPPTAETVAAITAAQPEVILLENIPQQKELLSKLKKLRGVFTQGGPDGIAEVLPNLEYLALSLRADNQPGATTSPATTPASKPADSLAWLAQGKNLRFLSITKLPGNTAADLSVLKSLPKLTALELMGDIEAEPDMASIGSLKGLKVLALNETADVTPLAKLANLEYLCVMKSNLDGLRSLEKLTKLRVLLVAKSALTERKDDIAYLQTKLPQCAVIGVCLGSWMILLVVPAGLAAAWLVQVVRRRAGKARANAA